MARRRRQRIEPADGGNGGNEAEERARRFRESLERRQVPVRPHQPQLPQTPIFLQRFTVWRALRQNLENAPRNEAGNVGFHGVAQGVADIYGIPLDQARRLLGGLLELRSTGQELDPEEQEMLDYVS